MAVWGHLSELALQSPVLVALIGLVGLLVGRQILQAQIKLRDDLIAALKDAHAATLQAKDAMLAGLERETPTRMREYAEAMKTFFELRAAQQELQIHELQVKLDEYRRHGTKERTWPRQQLREPHTELAAHRAPAYLAEGTATKLAALRSAAFAFLRDRVRVHGDLIARADLQQGFIFEGQRVPLVGPHGIFKPAIVRDAPLSITSAPPVGDPLRQYENELQNAGRLVYRYRGTDPNHPDNVGLRRAMERRVPLVYFQGIAPGLYATVFPVYVVGDDPVSLAFTIQADEPIIAA
jgi:hypothetical protein